MVAPNNEIVSVLASTGIGAVGTILMGTPMDIGIIMAVTGGISSSATKYMISKAFNCSWRLNDPSGQSSLCSIWIDPKGQAPQGQAQNAAQQPVNPEGWNGDESLIDVDFRELAKEEVIDAEFELFICGSDDMFTPMELGLDGKFNNAKKPVSYEVKLFEMSNDKIGRLILSQYLDQPSLDLEGYERYMIKDTEPSRFIGILDN
eukprot:Em0012g358a